MSTTSTPVLLELGFACHFAIDFRFEPLFRSVGGRTLLIMKWFKDIGASITTVLIFVILLWWLIVVSRYVGTAPTLDSKGNTIQDTFGNAKDILLAVLPLATTAVGYWFGSQGTSQAQDTADQANAAAQSATETAKAVQAQLTAVVDQSQPGTLAAAKRANPELFGLASDGNGSSGAVSGGARTSGVTTTPAAATPTAAMP